MSSMAKWLVPVGVAGMYSAGQAPCSPCRGDGGSGVCPMSHWVFSFFWAADGLVEQQEEGVRCGDADGAGPILAASPFLTPAALSAVGVGL